MQYTDDSDSEATDTILAKIVDLAVENSKERGKSGKSENQVRERNLLIVDSSDSHEQSELVPCTAKDRCGESIQKKQQSRRKEKVLSSGGIAWKEREELPVVQWRKHKSEKKGKGKEIAHSDGSVEFESDPDEPGPLNPRKKPLEHGGFARKVKFASDCRSPASLQVKKKIKKKKAEQVEEVQEDSDVEMDTCILSAKQALKECSGYQS